MSKIKIVKVLIGVVCTGKTTFREKQMDFDPGLVCISFDDIRFRMLDFKNTGKNFDQKIEGLVEMEAFENFEDSLKAGKNIIFDSTNVTSKRRFKIYAYAKKYKYKIEYYVFDNNPSIVFPRNDKRILEKGINISNSVIISQLKTLEFNYPEKHEYDKIYTQRKDGTFILQSEGLWKNI